MEQTGWRTRVEEIRQEKEEEKEEEEEEQPHKGLCSNSMYR